MWFRLASSLCTAVVLSGCIKGFDPASKLGGGFLVLAIQVDPPSAHAGERVHASSLWYVPADATAAVDALWILCVPQMGEGPEACMDAAMGQVFGRLGQCRQACESDPDPESCRDDCALTALSDSMCGQGVPAKACVAGFGGRTDVVLPIVADPPPKAYLFLLAAAGADGLSGCADVWVEEIRAGSPAAPTGDCTLSVKSVALVGPGEEDGTNPVIQDVLIAGGASKDASTLTSGTTVDLSVVPAPAQGSYLSWFSDCGDLDHSKTLGSDNRLKPSVVGSCEVDVAVRDGQGGLGFFRVAIAVAQPDS
ncbi:MAG: hypothetical protein J7M25_00290 [Deltaproteobacteria bacterium]|nr:hypothetical protein [Deltaproteobacteria bacterium]